MWKEKFGNNTKEGMQIVFVHEFKLCDFILAKQLQISTKTGFHKWSEEYEDGFINLVAFEDEEDRGQPSMIDKWVFDCIE